MSIEKGSRHQKIIGNFGETLICNWLSRSGFEVAVVDHVGIDVVAYHTITKKRLVISVKSRTRVKGAEFESVFLLTTHREKQENSDRIKLLNACEAFGCEPWIAIYVESEFSANLYLTSLENYDPNYAKEKSFKNETQKVFCNDWKMTEKYKERYKKDLNVKHIHIDFNSCNWNW